MIAAAVTARTETGPLGAQVTTLSEKEGRGTFSGGTGPQKNFPRKNGGASGESEGTKFFEEVIL
jgi:hypothetical protein